MSKLNTPTSNYESGYYQESQLSLSLQADDIIVPGAAILTTTLHDHIYGSSFVIGDRAFVMGGGMVIGSILNTKNEEYDPVLNTWSLRAPMLSARRFFCTFVKDGKGYVARGDSHVAIDSWDYEVNMTIDSYSPSTNTWTTEYTSCIAINGRDAGLRSLNDYTPDAVVVDNVIYIIGGDYGTKIEVIENGVPRLLKNEWNNDVKLYLSSPVCAFVKNKSIYISSSKSKLVKFDTLLKTFTDLTGPSVPRRYGSVEFFKNKYYHVGGVNYYGYAINVCEAYDVDNNIWSSEEVMNFAGYGGISFVVKDKLYSFSRIIPGGTGGASRNEVLESTGTWKNIIDIIKKPEIRYTLDGSEPGIDSNTYTNPIVLELPKTIKTKVVFPDYEDSDVLTITLEKTIKEIINFDPSKLFSNYGVLSNVNVFTQLELDIKSEYNTLKDYDSQKCINMKNTMILGMKSMSNGEVIALQNISDDILSSEWYVLVIDKSDISVGIDRTPKHNLNVVGRCDIDIRDIFLPYTSDRLIYKFNAGPRGIDLLQKLSIKLAMDDVDFQGRYTFKTFAIFKLSDFEKYIIKDFNKITLTISDPDLNSDDTLLKNEAISEFKKNINDTVKKCIHEYLPGYESLYTKTILTHRVKNTDNMTEISCKFYRDANMTDLIFEDILFSDSFNSEQDTTGYISMNVVSPISITDILKSITVEEVLNDRFGYHKKYTLEMNTSEVFEVKELSKLSIPTKTKTERASLLFFSGGGISKRITPAPVLVEYDNLNTITPDAAANTYHKNNPEPFVFKNTMLNKIKPIGNITDTFDTYREFYYETVNKTYVPNIDESHEWFRLYGSTREDAIKNAFAIKRKDKNSMLIVNGIPIQYTSLRLVEYLEHEYIVVNSENDIRTLGELHVYNFSTYPSDAALFIHRDGVVNASPTDGYCIGDYKEVLEFGKGVHYIPDDYVSIGRNYLVVDNSNKIKYYPKKVIYHNKIVIVEDDDTKVFVPIKRSFSMFESVMRLLYTKIGQDINEWNLILDAIDDDTRFMTEFSKKLKFSPNIAELKYIEDQPFYSDIDVFLKNTTVEQTKFIFEENDLNIINNPDTQLFGKVYTPKILIPVKETSKNILVFMNDKLFKVNPERIDEHHIILDIRDVYDLKEYTITNEFEDIMRWYNMNKTNNVFEVKLYDEEDVILENTFTKDNDNFVPIPLNLVDRNFEVYIDGMYAGTHDDCVLYDYHNIDGFYMTEGATINTKLGLLVNTLNDNRPNIPVLFMKKTSKKYEYSIGSKVVIICTKDPVRAMKVPISDGLVYVHAGIWDDTEFFYSTGTRLMHSDYEQLSSHVIYIKNDFDGFIIIKSRHSYYNKDIIISPDYSISLMETLELEMTPKVINDTLFEMSDDEFDAYCYVVSIAMYLMKNGLSNNSDDFGNIRLWTPVLQSSPLSISGTVNGLNVSMNDIMIQKSMTEVGYTTVVAKISPYVYLEPKEVDDTYMNNLYFYRKVSYILSLYFGEYLSQHKVNKFDISLFDDPTIPNNLVLDVKGEYLSKYNAIFGKVTSVPTFNNLDVTGSLYDIFTLYEVTDRVPVPYGILPLDSFGGSGQKVVNPEARRLSSFRGNLSVPSNSTITSYLRGKISVYYISS